jgi:hypothetical protein
MHTFDLENGKFHSYNNRTISSDQPWSLTGKGEDTLLRLVSRSIFINNKQSKLSFRFKINRFLTHFKWSDIHYTSGGGNINDSNFFINEIVYHLSKLINLTYFSSSEIRELLISGIRVYFKDGWSAGTPIYMEDLTRCVNLQEFYSNELEINFEFAENLKNLRKVDLYVNDANNKNGLYRETIKRDVINIDKLTSCQVLYLIDSHVKDFSKIPVNILLLSLRNSNFENIQDLSHIKNIEYLDISYTDIKSIVGLYQLKNLKILNLCCTKFNSLDEIIKITRELISLDSLELIIIDTENTNAILATNLIDTNFKNKIIEVPNNYNIGFIDSWQIADIFKLNERIKKHNNKAYSDSWNMPIEEFEEKLQNEIKIDFVNTKKYLLESLNKRGKFN